MKIIIKSIKLLLTNYDLENFSFLFQTFEQSTPSSPTYPRDGVCLHQMNLQIVTFSAKQEKRKIT